MVGDLGRACSVELSFLWPAHGAAGQVRQAQFSRCTVPELACRAAYVRLQPHSVSSAHQSPAYGQWRGQGAVPAVTKVAPGRGPA